MPASYAFAFILFFGRGGRRGGRTATKPADSRLSSADYFEVEMKRMGNARM